MTGHDRGTTDERFVDPGAVSVVSMASAASAPADDRFLDPGPIAVATTASTPTRVPTAGAPAPAVAGPSNGQLFQIASAVARRHGVDHSTVEVDPQGDDLRLGIGRFGLASGELGEVLRLAHLRAPEQLREALAGDLDALLAVTTADDPGARRQPVSGEALWEGSWPGRLRALTALPAVRHAQNEWSIEHQVRPLVPIAIALGGRDGRAVALLLDRALTTGAGPAVDAAVDVLATCSDEEALGALGLDWAGLRSTTPWLHDEGGPDPFARAALHARVAETIGHGPVDIVERLSTTDGWSSSLATDADLSAIPLVGDR